jgi:hypothetical protein
MIELVALTFLLLAVFAVVTLGLAVLKIVLWTVLLPLRLLFNLLLVPLLLIKALVGGLALFVVGPIVGVVLLGATLIAAIAVFAPLLPFLFIGCILWMVLRAARGPALAR